MLLLNSLRAMTSSSQNKGKNSRRGGPLRRVRALIIKEFYQIVRDPSSILICLVLPLIFLFIYGYGVSLDIDHLKIGIVLEDNSPEALGFVKSFTDSSYFDVSISRDRKQMERDIVTGKIRGFIVIPSYFSAFRHRRDVIAPIQVIADGSETNTANFVQNYVQSTWNNWLRQEKISGGLRGLSPVTIEPRFWYNEQLESRNFLIPGSVAIIMTLIGTLLTSLVVAREWERGTMEAIIATPVTPQELLIGKFIPYFVLAMSSMSLCVAFATFVYHIPFRGSFLVLSLVSAIFLYSALGVGLLISTMTRNQFLASQIAVVVGFMPAFILSGFIFEISSMPIYIRFLTYFIPARYFVSSLLTLFLVGDVWHLLLINMIPMLILGTILFLVIKKIMVKRLD
jgi:ABC-2 type transport system permease protein